MTEVLKTLFPFWSISAEWWPCRAIAPIVEGLAKDYVGKIAVFKMNVDENYRRPRPSSVTKIPTLLNGGRQKVNQLIGSVPRGALEDFVKTAL
ncbi:MAG: thioredoxin domain-containing protein [bacterium]